MARKKQNRLNPDNCNKAMCKTCIFQTNGEAIELSHERRNEIQLYLATGQSSHVCHTTNKTCYGGLQFQAQIFYRMGLIPEETVNSLLDTASKFW